MVVNRVLAELKAEDTARQLLHTIATEIEA